MIIDNIPEINYGKLIATTRIQLKLTQEVLANEICSIPYLSKIENGKIDANPEILTLLCKKLNIAYDNIEENNNNIKLIIEELYIAINEDDEHNVELLWGKLKKLNDRTYNPDLKNFLYLIEIRYCLYSHNYSRALELINHLKKFKKTLNHYQLFYFYYFVGLAYLHNQNYLEGIKAFLKACSFGNKSEKTDYHLLYYLSLSYSHMRNSPLAIQHGLNALSFFQKNFNYNRFIECQIILGINYIRIKQYTDAQKYFENVLKIADKNKDDITKGRVLHNLGYLESKRNKHENAVNYYLKSLEYKSENDAMFLNTIYFLSRECIFMNHKEDALCWLDKGISLSENNYIKMKIYYIKLNVLKLSLSDQFDSYIKFLENEAIPYLKEINDHPTLAEYYEILGDLYAKNNFSYKKSCYYYKQSLNLMERN